MARRLVDGQAHLIVARNVHNLSTGVAVHVVVREIGDHLLQPNDLLVGRLVLRKVVAKHGHVLVRRRLPAINR